MNPIPKHKKLIVFDGVCNLCNSTVKFVIKHDKANHFVFTAQQSNLGKAILKKYNINTEKTDSIFLVDPDTDKIYYKAKAALHIAKQLSFPINLISIGRIIPSFIANSVYDYIAKNRYKWYGKQDSCIMPTGATKSKFID